MLTPGGAAGVLISSDPMLDAAGTFFSTQEVSERAWLAISVSTTGQPFFAALDTPVLEGESVYVSADGGLCLCLLFESVAT